MTSAFAIVVWLLNFGISFWNAYAVGNSWVETKHKGGWPLFTAWAGAIMSATGFTWCYLIALAALALQGQWLDRDIVLAAVNLGYVLLIPGVIVAGGVITLDSWARAYRNRTIQDIGIAAWNSYAEYHNTFHAIDNIRKSFKYVMNTGSSSRSSDSEGKGSDIKAVLIMIVLVIVACLAGVITTAIIITRVAGDFPMEPRYGEPGAKPAPPRSANSLPPPTGSQPLESKSKKQLT